jgi:hypothetical protein
MIEEACKIEALLDALTVSDGKGGRIAYRDRHPRPKWWQDILDKRGFPPQRPVGAGGEM